MTNTWPVRFSLNATPASSAADRIAAITSESVEYTAAVIAPCSMTVDLNVAIEASVESEVMRKLTGPKHSCS